MDPKLMGIGPAFAIPPALEKARAGAMCGSEPACVQIDQVVHAKVSCLGGTFRKVGNKRIFWKIDLVDSCFCAGHRLLETES